MKEMIDSVTLPQLETLLNRFEIRARTSEFPDQKARILNLAGDICFDASQPERALQYYDQAITTYTTCQHYNSAAMICKKIVALTPEAVRAYSTLAWLAIVRGMLDEAQKRIQQYVRAAEAQGLTRIARTTLISLADISEASEILESIAEALLQLDDGESADRVYGKMLGHVPA